jgi:transcriptional antiterminator RfaH
MLGWYALNSKPRSEKYVSEILLSRGIETYLPLWRSPKGPGQAGKARPYFPSYLFARADLDAIGISVLQYLPGVRRLVFCGDQPARVEEAAINEIRRRLAELENSVMDSAGRRLSQGDRVLITGGPFQGYDAIFDRRLSSGERVRVLIDFLQKRTPLELESLLIQKRTFGAKGQIRALVFP